MTRLAGNPRATPDEWNAEALRLTVFLVPGTVANPNNWWRSVADSEPENSETKPRVGVRVDSGEFKDGLLVMQSQPNRVDWIYGNRPGELDDPFQPNFGQRLPLFSEAVITWLRGCPAITRLAFGVSLILETTSKNDSYHLLSNYLNFDLEPESSSDFNYQINRGRLSRTVPELWINRMTRWSAVRHVKLMGNLNLSESPSNFSLSSSDHSHGAKLELDINTSAERNAAIPDGARLQLYSELVQLAIEIVREGDIP